jgi:DNA repair exonuclease SbcCD nuclease subunit
MSCVIKSKKIGVFSDIHIGLGQDSSTWHDIVLNFAKWVSKTYTKAGINDIIIPGDIFHNRSEISVNTLATANEFFDILKDFRIFISAGNHDCYYKDRSDVNSISLFGGWKNIVVVDKAPLLIQAGEKTISLIPWGTEIDDIPKADICFGHFEIQTFYMNSFKVCDHGIESSNLLKKSSFIISGHFHSKDERSYKNGKIVYVGSPYQQNFGDVDQVRGVYILDIESEKLEFIENKISPKHIKVYLSHLRNKKQDADFLKENVPNNMVSFIVDEEITNDKITLLTAKLQNLAPKFFRIDYKSINTDLIENSSKVDYNLIDIEKNIEDFVNSIDVQHKEDVIEYLTNTYKELTL